MLLYSHKAHRERRSGRMNVSTERQTMKWESAASCFLLTVSIGFFSSLPRLVTLAK